MFKQFKIKTSQTPVYLTSDSHFCHAKPFVYEERGFSSVQEHDETLIKIWNETVPYNATVLHLGDFMLNGSKEQCEQYFNRLNGHIVFLWGNHESYTKKVYKESLIGQYGCENIEIYPLTWNNKVTFVGNYLHGFIDKVPFVASHFAYRVWDFMQHGAVNFCGHSHGSDKESSASFPFHKRLDVGTDNFGRPISFQEAMTKLNKKKIVQLDHHNSTKTSGF